MKSRRSADPLQAIPGVGPSIASDLRALGIERVEQLQGQDPEELYDRSNRLRGVTQDRCLLYVFRCAVYYAGADRPASAWTKWWNWSDEAMRSRRRGGSGSAAPRSGRSSRAQRRSTSR